MFEPGDKLLLALSAWGETSYARFKSLLQVLADPVETDDDNYEKTVIRRRRYEAQMALQVLGHAELVDEGAGLQVKVCPAVMAVLPLPGLPVAVHCGARSPLLLEKLRSACRELDCSVRVETQSGRLALSPSRIQVEALTTEALGEVAVRTDLVLQAIPPAWVLAENAGDLHGYRLGLQWREEPELNWERQDFDPHGLRFGTSRGEVQGTRLSRYKHPSWPGWEYRLWDGRRSAKVDPSWARYAILEDAGVAVLEYDQHRAQFGVPLGVPLPSPLARALALCIGAAPTVPNGSSRLVFDRVPADVATVVAGKLDQRLSTADPGRQS